MDAGDADWTNLSMGDREDSILSGFQKQDESSMGSEDMKSDQEDDDFASSLGLYNGYDSFNESVATSENEDLGDDSVLDEDLLEEDGITKYSFLNNKEGMATCERCGSVGVKHAFYSKSKRFCSLSCSRSYATYQGKPVPSKPSPPAAVKRGKPAAKKGVSPKNTAKTLVRGEAGRCFDWGPYLISSQAIAGPVSCFKHVPMHDCWDQMIEGVLVEVPNTDLEVQTSVKVYWIATVLKICGYKVLLRYEGFGSDGSKDFWSNLLSEDIHNVGWCATYGRMLSPPKTIKDKYLDWREFLIKRLTGTRTIPPHFHVKSQEWLNDHKFRHGMTLEVVNKMCVSAMRVSSIKDIIGGRLRLNYVDSRDENDEFWCHMTSPLIHPVGWSQSVGHKLHASNSYMSTCLSKVTMQRFGPNDSTPEMFPKMREPPHGLSFQVGMKLEAIDPLNLSAVCVATVTKVLRNNYLMIGIDGSMAENGSDWFCYHATSPCIFPVGFCEINNLDLTPPRGTKGPFRWFDYLKETRAVAAPVKLFDKEIPKHGFRPGMKVEAVDLMEPRLICVATVTKIVGRLLRIHFDGWENNYDQWIDCQSPDIYPVGWCEVMKHSLEGPRSRLDGTPGVHTPVNPRKRKGKTQMYRGPRKKRTSVSDKRSREPSTKSSPSMHSAKSAVAAAGVGGVSSAAVPTTPTTTTPPSSSAFPPHKLLSPEAVAATLPPPVLEPDMDTKPLIVKTEPPTTKSTPPSVSGPPDTTTTTSAPPPPILSPHGKSSQRFSQELAERLTSKTTPGLGGVSSSSSLPLPTSMLAQYNNGALESKATVSTLSSSNSLPVEEASSEGGGGGGGVIVLTLSSRLRALPLAKWSLSDVVDVLKVNGCAIYVNTFVKKNLDGVHLMEMTTDQLTRLVSGVPDGPILRLCDLVQQVKGCAGVVKGGGSTAVSKPAASDKES